MDQNQIIEKLAETCQNTIISNTNNNTNNNTINNNQQFNVQVFLNEKCQNAMNLSDFLKSIEVTNEDIENNAQFGFVKGIYKIISDNLQTLDLFERPIHCTDPKRETVFIKEDNQWSKEDHSKKINSMIQETSRKSLEQLFGQWKTEHPENVDLDSHDGQMCIQIQINSMGGLKYDEYYEKVQKKIIKGSVLDKKALQIT